MYDFIVIGSGSAGSVVANRLSENPNWRVALLEAGGSETLVHLIPAMVSYLQLSNSNWNYASVPQVNSCWGLNNNISYLPKGKVLGGTSSINFMIYNRGNRRDYDNLAAAGNPGWSYEEVLPYFLKSEAAVLNGLGNSRYHNTTGPLSVQHLRYRSQILEAYINGAQEAGHRLNNDYNGESQLGVSYLQANTRNGQRFSASRAFLQPIMQQRRNLDVFTYARVTRVIIDPVTKTATGVQFYYNENLYTFRASKEVILSAGSFNSAQLLMLSGVGPSDNLQAIGVDVIQDLPVGRRIYDHVSHFGPTFVTNTTGQTIMSNRATPSIILRFLAGAADTFLSSPGTVEALTFIKIPNSTLPDDLPDVELIFATGSLASDNGIGMKMGGNIKDEIYDRLYRDFERTGQDHFTILVMPFHPKSVGRMWLTSRNPLQWPTIDPNYFDDPSDVEEMLAGIKAAIRITQTPAMRRIGTQLLNRVMPGCEQHTFASDDYWRCSIRTMTYTLHHQVGACRMGPANDPKAVVNPKLQVHGIRNLRVIDVSVLQRTPTAHTHAAAVMIGEKGSDLIKEAWQ